MADVDLTPTAEMARNAERGLELRREHGRGGTEVGVARARDISNGKGLSPETVRRMHAFFSRHAKNKAGGEDDAGYIAWMLWGGDEGRDWASRKVDALDRKEMNAMSETRKAIMERLGMAATNDRPGAKAKFAQPPFSASDLNALKRLVKQYEQQAKTSKGKQGPNGENLEFKALSIAGWMQEMINYAQAGQTHRAYAIVRTSHPDYVRFLPPSLVKAAWDVTKMSRPGAKAKMGKLSGLTDATLKGEATRLLRLWHHTKSGESGLQPSTVRYRILELVEEMQSRNMADPKLYAILKTTSFSRPGAKAAMAANDVPLNKPFTVRGKKVIVRKAYPDGYEIFPTSGAYSLGKTNVLNLEAVIQAMEAQNRKAASHLLSLLNDRPGAKAKMGKVDRARVLRELRALRDNAKAERNKEAERLASMYLAGLNRANTTEDDWEEADMATSKILDALHGEYARPGAKVRAALTDAKPAEDDLEREDVKAGLKLMAASDPAVSDKIRTLIKEGKPQEQAVAIALDMKRRGEL